MLIILTGEVESGKSTVCRGIVEKLRADNIACGGAVTVKKNDSLIFQSLKSGESAVFARRARENMEPDLSRYDFYPAGFAFGNRVLRESVHSQVLIADEIGQLECAGKGLDSIFNILNTRIDRINLIVVRKKSLQKLISLLNFNAEIFEVTPANRNDLPQNIINFLKSRNRQLFSN